MATLNFPDNPSTGDEYYDSNAGFNYEWNGVVWITKDLASPDNIREIDDISSGFDGSDTTFTLQIDNVNIVPKDVKQLVISVGGVMQNPGDDYTLSGSTLTFTSAPSTGLSFVGTFLGAAASLNTITAGSVSPSSLTTTSNYTVGSIKVSGASTIGNFVLTGLTTIADPDVTNFNSSGVGTVSNVIITPGASGIGATVGAAVGVITYFGDASNLTGAGMTLYPLVYGPGIGSTSQKVASDIVTTWNYPLQAGSGTITIRTGSDSGTIVDQFVVGSSSSITISGRTLTLNPAVGLSTETDFFVVYPKGAVKSTSGQKENNRLVTSFSTGPLMYKLFAWGKNGRGQLGQNTNASPTSNGISSPVQVGTGAQWKYLYSANVNSSGGFAGKDDGTIWAWGYNYGGNLGLNQSTPGPLDSISSPTQLPGTNWVDIQSGYYHHTAIKTDGTLWAWGYNTVGCLGLNQIENTYYSSPTQIGTDTDWTAARRKVTAAIFNNMAIKTDGTLWQWGYNPRGQLGLNDVVNRSSPTQVGTDTNWATTDPVMQPLMGAIKTDGTLWVWGQNQFGGLGLNESGTAYPDYLYSHSSPTQLPGTNWKNFSSSNLTSWAVKTDGTLWSWGKNQYGDAGLNTPITSYISSPTQVGTDTTWTGKFAFTQGAVSATKTDGTFWTWGSNAYGALGHNSIIAHSSPTQIPGTWLNEVGGISYAFLGIEESS